jgi:CHAT domain-containing protein
MIGLSWAFFVAGCPTTVASQWKVDSASTTELMLSFHRNVRKGQSKAAALRSAALTLLDGNRYRHPFYWAGFVVIGDGS